MMEIRNLSKKFGKRIALDCVSIELTPGLYGLLGPNGSGKTTLLRHIAKIYPDEGEAIFWDNENIRTKANFNRLIGYLPQKFGAFPYLTLVEFLEIFAELKEIPRKEWKNEINSVLSQVGLMDRAEDKMKSLSGGMVRRMGIAQALLGNPKIQLFDEPTSGLDPEERLRFKNIFSSHRDGSIRILSTHIVEDVDAVCDRIVIIHHGQILFTGTQKELVDFARGFVYEINDELSLPEDAFVLKRYNIDGQEKLRVLSELPILSGKMVEPTIEDGYMLHIHSRA